MVIRDPVNDNTLSPQQTKVFQFLKDRFYSSGSMPTLREICKAMNWKAVGSAQSIIEALVQKGWLKRDPHKARGLLFSESNNFRPLPILGSAPAGSPIDALEQHSGDAIVPNFVRGPAFAVKVKGDSMEGIGLEDGDIAIIRETTTAQHGDVVLAMIQGEMTIKTLERKDREIWLKPENAKYKPRKITDSSFRILGKVIGIHRYWER